MKSLLVAAFVLMILLMPSCHEERPAIDRSYIVFGSFHGECAGERCVEIYKIDQGHLYQDTLDHYPPSAAPYEGSYLREPDSLYTLVKNITDEVSDRMADEKETVIGMPDAYDQGGYYLELRVDGRRRYWLIDADSANIPASVRPTTAYLSSALAKLD